MIKKNPIQHNPIRNPHKSTTNIITSCIICTLFLLPIKMQAVIKDEIKPTQDTFLCQEQITNKNFTITIDQVAPMGKRTIKPTSTYTLKISNDTIYSNLPYYGRAYNAPYGGGETLQFEKKAENYTCKKTKRNNIRCEFNIRTKDDHYTFQIEIFKNGTARISVTTLYKQAITFYGTIQCD